MVNAACGNRKDVAAILTGRTPASLVKSFRAQSGIIILYMYNHVPVYEYTGTVPVTEVSVSSVQYNYNYTVNFVYMCIALYICITIPVQRIQKLWNTQALVTEV